MCLLCFRDGITVSILNCGTSILCGFVVFSVIGFLSHELGVSPDQVVTGGKCDEKDKMEKLLL